MTYHFNAYMSKGCCEQSEEAYDVKPALDVTVRTAFQLQHALRGALVEFCSLYLHIVTMLGRRRLWRARKA